MAKFNIDGLKYSGKPHSRVEKILYDILAKEGGGGGGSGDVAIPYEIGKGLKVDGDVLSIDTTDDVAEGNEKPITSNGTYNEITLVNEALEKV